MPEPVAMPEPVPVRIYPIAGIGEVHPGDDLVGLLGQAAPWLADADVLVVTSKIVSKAEGRLVDVPPSGPDRDAVRDAALDGETARIVARRGPTRIVQTHHGFVLANAGIDASNVDTCRLVLLPKDPDASARGLRAGLRERYGVDVAVVVTDTMGRAWRRGLVDAAIGSAGIRAVVDYRGSVDPYGNELSVTEMAVIDELAAAAELVKGKCDGVPAAVVRGYRYPVEDGAQPGDGAAALIRPPDEDMFRLGTAEAHAAGLRDAARLTDAVEFGADPVDPAVVDRAVAALGVPFARLRPDQLPAPLPARLPARTAVVIVPGGTPAEPDLWAAAQLGAVVHRLRAGLAADGLATAWVPFSGRLAGVGYHPLGLLAVGAGGPAGLVAAGVAGPAAPASG